MDVLSTMFSNFAVRVLGDGVAARYGLRRKLPWSSVRKVSTRLLEVVDKASVGSGSRERTLAAVCERIPGLSLSALEGFATGSAEVDVERARKICEVLGASFDYVWRGDGAPFSEQSEEALGIREYLQAFRQEDVTAVYFVRGDRMPHLGYTVLQYDELKYRVLPLRWHVSSENGHGGSVDLYELAWLSERLQRSFAERPMVFGLEASSDAVEAVSLGESHPHALWSKKSKRSHWWDDIADVDLERPCAKKYAVEYGDEFLNAQRLIRWIRDEEGPRRLSELQDNA